MNEPTMSREESAERVELCFVFPRARAERLAHAERLLRWFCGIHASALVGLDVAFDGPQQNLFAFARMEPGRFGTVDLRRVEFWVSRAGGSVSRPGSLSPEDWETLQRSLVRCDVRAIGLDARSAEASIVAIATAAGLDPDRRGYAEDRPVLTIDIGGPGWDGVRWNDDEEALFVASPLAPPLGDPVPVLFRTRGGQRAAIEWARVVGVRPPSEAVPGHPAGFHLGLATSPRDLKRELATCAPTAEYGTRAAPRYAFRRPLDANFRRVEDGAQSRHSVAGRVENLSLGGAFVKTAAPLPEGAEMMIAVVLPNGARLTTQAFVAFKDILGMGVRFVLDRAGITALHGALTLLSARPRRAMVVDDDLLARKMMADALVERGFEVLTASDAEEGLRVLAEEILSLDLLVTDHFLPGKSGEEFVAKIRGSGGEAELVIVVMTGSPDRDLAERVGRAGADLLLGKELGPEIVALKADMLLNARGAGGQGRTLPGASFVSLAPKAPRPAELARVS